MMNLEVGERRDFTVVSIFTPGSRQGREGARIATWNDGQAPESVHEVHTLTKWGYIACDCPAGREAEKARRSGTRQNVQCEHVAIFRTWKRQGRPSKNPQDPNESWARVYFIDKEDDNAHRIGYYRPNGDQTKLSTVEQVNAVDDWKDN